MPVFAFIGLFVFFMQASVTVIARAQLPVQNSTSTGAIAGSVTINGKPAPRVRIVLAPYDSPASDILPQTVTDEKGNYRLTGIPEGSYQVMPAAPSYVIDNGPHVGRGRRKLFYGPDLASIIVPVVRGETVNGVDFPLSSGGVITGRVIDARGQPVVEAYVSCHQLSGQNSIDCFHSRQTDDRGVYRLYGLPAGSYLVSVTVSRSEGNSRQRAFHPGVTDQMRATPVKVDAGGEVANIDIQLGRPVKTHHLSGRVVDGATGRPISGVYLRYYLKGSSGNLRPNSQGEFKIQDCLPGRYILAVVSFNTPAEEFYSDPTVVDVADEDVTGIEIKAHRGGSISGVVVVENTDDPKIVGRLSQLSLTASWPQLQDDVFRSLGLLSNAQTWAAVGIGGKFEFTGLPPSRINIAPSDFPEGYHLLRIERDGLPILGEITIAPEERVTGIRIVVGYGTGSIRGRAMIEGGVLPDKSGWVISILRANGERAFLDIIDASGNFWFKGLMAGEYEVIAEADYEEIPGVTPSPHPPPVKQKVTVVNGKETEVTLVLNLKGEGKKRE